MSDNDKWAMFKNYMHNELGITKEDIRTWITDAVKEEARRLVDQEKVAFNVDNIIRKIMQEDGYFSTSHLRQEVLIKTAEQLSRRLSLTLKE